MYAARVAYCAPRGIPLSVFLGWSDADQEAALAWQAQEARRCSGCGTDSEDWGDGNAWIAEVVHCPGCAKRETAQATISKQAKGAHVRLVRNT